LLLPQFNRAYCQRCVRPESGHWWSQRVEWYSTPHTGNCQQNPTRKLSFPLHQRSIPILVLRFDLDVLHCPEAERKTQNFSPVSVAFL